MKSFNKIISCLLLGTTLSALSIHSVYAMKNAIFLFDEELEEMQSQEAKEPDPAVGRTFMARVTPTAETLSVVKIAPRTDFSPQTESPLVDSMLREPLPKASSPFKTEMANPYPSLQTEELIKEKRREFSLKYQEILRKRESKIDDLHKWKLDIFGYLGLLYQQPQGLPGSISDRQILDFFLDMVKEFNPVPLPKFNYCDYRLRFDSLCGLSGSIVCSPCCDPHRILAML